MKSWNLYWVSSDGYEDCFVIARNSRSARSIEYHETGFDFNEIRADLIIKIPKEIELIHQKKRNYKQKPWPRHINDRRFFIELGAEFRNANNKEEMLLNDTVFIDDGESAIGMRLKRTVGKRSIDEMKREETFSEISDERDDDDDFHDGTIHIATMLGLCLIRCQQIEDYIVKSFLLGISKKQKAKYKTINDLREGWKRKTLGNMLKSIEEAWEIHPDVKAGLDLFLHMRNKLIHGITTDDEFDIRTRWGQKELISFLYFFDIHSKIIRKAFRSSFYASMKFGMDKFKTDAKHKKNIFNKKQKEEMSMFFHFFTPKEGCI